MGHGHRSEPPGDERDFWNAIGILIAEELDRRGELPKTSSAYIIDDEDEADG